MPEGDSRLDQQLIDKYVDQNEASWRRLVRNAVLAAIAVGTIHCITFPQYVRLSDELPAVKARIDRASRDLLVVHQTGEQLDQANGVLQSEMSQLQQELDGTVEKLVTRIADFSDHINSLRSRAAMGPSGPEEDSDGGSIAGIGPDPGDFDPTLQLPPFNMAAQMPLDIDSLRPPELELNLSLEDRRVIERGDMRSDEFRRVVTRYVNEEIVRPVFDDLNRRKKALVENFRMQSALVTAATQPVDTATTTTTTTARTETDTTLASIREKLSAVESQLAELTFRPPPTPDWWRTERDKAVQIEKIEVETQSVADDVDEQLAGSKLDVSSRVETLLETRQLATQRQAEIEQRLADIQAQLSQTQQMLGVYQKPLPFIVLKVSDLAPFYPVFLSLIFAYIAVSAVSLHARTCKLVAMLRQRGMSQEVGEVYFGRFDPLQRMRIRWSGHTVYATLAVYFLAAAALAGVSLHWTFSSEAIRLQLSSVHHWMYAAGGFLLLASLVYAITQLVRASREVSGG